MAAPWDHSTRNEHFRHNIAGIQLNEKNNAGFRPQHMQEIFSRPYRPQNFQNNRAARPQNQQFQGPRSGIPPPNFFQGHGQMQQNSNFRPPDQNNFTPPLMQQYGTNRSMIPKQENLLLNEQSAYGFPSQNFNHNQGKRQNFQPASSDQSFSNTNVHQGFFPNTPAQLPQFNQPPPNVSGEFHQSAGFHSEIPSGQGPVSTEDMERKSGEEWIKKWLTKRKTAKKGEILGHSMTLSEAQDKTRHMIVLLAKLQKNKQQLESMKHEDKTIWGQKLNEVNKIKAEFEALHQELTSPEAVKALKRKIAKRRSKRRRIKRQKHDQYTRLQEELACRQKKNEEIDQYMEQARQKIERQKQEEAMKKEGDQILGEVKKKISEATKTVQLLESLQKLRKLRVDRLERQGVLGHYEGLGAGTSQRFEETVTGMTQLLKSQLQTYQAEESALKVILETEHEETREKEREKQMQREEEQRLKELKKEDKILFGYQREATPGDPMYPFAQYYKAAETSLDALISIRRDWDMYLVMPDTPGASATPGTWVMPGEPSSEAWKKFLQDNT